MNVKTLFTLIASWLLVAACTTDEAGSTGDTGFDAPMPVLFSSGTTQNATVTRATTPYMQQGGKFICRMYYQGHAESTDYTDYTQAWLQVNNTTGNCVFRKSSYAESDSFDTHGFDSDAPIFYWQNRKEHVFTALADYNKLNEKCQLKISTDTLPFCLKRTEAMKTIEDQQDIIQAYTRMKPAGATPEANRVKLVFKHCFSKVQVNLKPAADGGLDGTDSDGKARITADCIDSVELLGIADSAYVFAVSTDTIPYETGYKAPVAKTVVANDYPDVDATDNPYYTRIAMFKADEASQSNYLTTHNVITFGILQAIRVTWHEPNNKEMVHVVTKKVENESGGDDIKTLKSGYQHIFNMDLRRGTLALINAEITEWKDGNQYAVNGTIQKNND